MNGEIDLRQELDELINKHGHWFVLRQAVPGRLCLCIDPITKDCNPRCNICLGSGNAFIDRFVKGRKSRPVRLSQTADMESRASLGIVTVPEAVFYIQYDIRPTELDFIIELALSINDQEPEIPYRSIGVYSITDSRELRDQGGRIEYFSITAQRKNWGQFEITDV